MANTAKDAQAELQDKIEDAGFAEEVEAVRQQIFGLMTYVKGNGEPMTEAEITEHLSHFSEADRRFIKAASDFSNATDNLYPSTALNKDMLP